MDIRYIECTNCGSGKVKPDVRRGVAVCLNCGCEFEIPKIDEQTLVTTKRVGPRKEVLIALIAVLVMAVLIAGIIILNIAPWRDDTPPSNAYRTDGVYLCGTEIDAGDFVLYNKDTDKKGYFEVRLTRETATNHTDFIGGKEFSGRQHVTLETGQYIYLRNVDLYRPETVKVRKLDETGYLTMQLKVGVDIPAGEYLLCSYESRVFYLTSRDYYAGIHDLNAPSNILYESGEYRLYLTVNDGEFLYYGGRLYALDYAPAIVKDGDNSFGPGQYKLGADIPYGKYTFADTSLENSSHRYLLVNGNSIASFPNHYYPDSLIEGKYTRDVPEITLNKPPDGETHYLTLINCKLIPYKWN